MLCGPATLQVTLPVRRGGPPQWSAVTYGRLSKQLDNSGVHAFMQEHGTVRGFPWRSGVRTPCSMPTAGLCSLTVCAEGRTTIAST